jgi:hypothetical protein
MKDSIYVRVTPNDSASLLRQVTERDVTHIHLNVDYVKGRGIVMSAYPAIRKSGQSEQLVITAGMRHVLDPNPTKAQTTKTSLAGFHNMIRLQAEQKCGETWALVLKLCAERGYTAGDLDAAITAA